MRTILTGLLALYLCGGQARAADMETADADWPQFRGLERNGASAERGLLRSWPEAGPREVWRRPIGPAFSSVAVAGDRLYTMSSDGEMETVVCLRADTGEQVWSVPIGELFEETFGNGPRSTPTVDDDVVYALSSIGKLHALRAADGTRIWQIDLQEVFGSPMPRRGFAPSPLVNGELLLLDVGGTEGRAFVALDKRTGDTRWTALDGKPGYSSPILVTIDGVEQYVFASSTGGGIVSLLPNGDVHWQHEWKGGAIAMPLFVPPNRIFVSAAEDIGAILLEVGSEGGKSVREIWQTRAMKNHFSSSIYHQGHIYGFDNATFKCLAAETGETRWARRGFGKGSLILVDGLLVVLGDRGIVALVEADASAYRESGRHQALEGKAWTAPAMAHGRLYLRDQSELVCFDLRDKG